MTGRKISAKDDTRFRVLDLGAHDGFVTQFVQRQAAKHGVELYVDGIEANIEGVRLFNERAERDGLGGHCKKGLVMDAPQLFRPASYDAVVAYELIEHVVDIDEFLDCIESMCKPRGRVYVSTPNGTFGSGNNPHHLRTWNMIELFDIIRQRGIITDALPGPDGVTVISYRPRSAADRSRVDIFCGPGWEAWSPTDIETKGLGGSETAAIRLGEKLADEYGCIVTVYGECAPGAAGQVLYRHHTSFDPTNERDLFICSRVPQIFERNINTKASLLWAHDVDFGPGLKPEYMEKIGKIMCLSRWHHDHLLETYDFLTSDDLYITRNGIEPSYFNPPEGMERNPHRACYTSSPDRGLDILLEIWPDVRKQVPDAELYYCYANVYNAVAAHNPAVASFRDHIRGLEEGQEGVVNIGAQPQQGVAALMMSSGVWLAPSYSSPGAQPFNETFCIGAVEAAAAGCHRVMSAWGALEERDEGEYPSSRWIPANADGGVQREAFVGAIVKAMIEDVPFGPSQQALEMDWTEVAADMLAAAFQPVA